MHLARYGLWRAGTGVVRQMRPVDYGLSNLLGRWQEAGDPAAKVT
jgi:hypothetical protein